MATIVACPKCGSRFRVSPELLGKRLRCLKCQHVFAGGSEGIQSLPSRPPSAPPAPIPAQVLDDPAPDVDEDDELASYKRRRRPRRSRDGHGVPGYLWVFAFTPWGVVILTLGGCISVIIAGSLCAAGVGLVNARRVSVGLRLAGLLGLNGVGYAYVLLIWLLFIILATRQQPGQATSRTVAGQQPQAPVRQAPPPVTLPPDESGPDLPPPPVQDVFQRGPRVYLAALPEFGVVAGPWPFCKDGTVGDGRRISVNGVPSPQGLAMHPPDGPGYSSVRYRLGKQAALFKAAVAINDTSTQNRNPAVFEVRGDGKRLWLSAFVKGPGQSPQECSIPVPGVDILELRVYARNIHLGLHAVWLQPRLLQAADTPDGDTPALFAAGPRVYLSDLDAFDVQSGPWPFSKNGRTGEGDNRIVVGGVASPKGLGMHPPNSPGYAAARFRLGKQAAVFKAAAALDDAVQLVRSQAVFEVYGDGQRLWQSVPVGKGTTPHECSLDVTGVDVLELRVRSQGSHIGLHAVWVEPRLLQKADSPDR